MVNEDREIDGQDDYPKVTANTTRRQKSIIDLWAPVNASGLDQDVHVIPLDSLFQRFHTDQCSGLSTRFVVDARSQYGKNKITPAKSASYFWLLLKQLLMGFNSILWVGGVLAFVAYEPLGGSSPSTTNLGLGVILFVVIIFNAILNFCQEMKSIKIVASFSKQLPMIATVRRDGIEQQIVADEIVPGDIILIRMGDKLPADCRFLACDGIKVNASELTGKSKPVASTVECSSQDFMESTNIGFYSSLVEQGTGEAMVIAIGDNTLLGKMSRIARGNSDDEITGLHREVNRFVLFIVLTAMISIIILWITWGAWLKYSHPTFVTFTGNILNCIGMIVGFLPLGLPSVINLVLTFVAKRMYHQHVLAKSLQIVETLNSVSVIATDKTGTLTENNMTVTNILWDTDSEYKLIEYDEQQMITKAKIQQMSRRQSIGAVNIGNRGMGKVAPLAERLSSEIDKRNNKLDVESQMKIEVFRDLLVGAALCNDAEKQLVQDDQLNQDISKINSELRLVGDAVDVALYNLCVHRCHMEINELRCLNPRLKLFPFNSLNKFMISSNRLEPHDLSSLNSESTILITLKGAPDIVIQRCSSYKNNYGHILPLTSQIKEKLLNRQEILGKSGYRLIGICQQKFSQSQYDQIMQHYEARRRFRRVNDEDLNGFPSSNYCFIGLLSLFDPSRVDVPDSILKLRRAHIRVAMITGDHPSTAKAIAKQVNIFSREISEINGLDTFQIEQNQTSQLLIRLYRNETLLQQHVTIQVTPFNSETKAARAMGKQIEVDNGKGDIKKEPPWYQRCYSSCKNQFIESKQVINQQTEKEKIPHAILVTGSQIDLMDDFMWNWVLSHQELIFARTSPEQKLRIVMEFQRRGETVAVIGDGNNDASSLKCAHVGVSMQSGTKICKEAADMILLDNSFSSIVQSIETGRLLNDNLKKVAIYLLPGGSWSEIWPVFFNIWFEMPLALSAFLSIVFCMLNDLFMSIALSREKPESDIMCRLPSNRKKGHLLNLKLLVHAYLFVGNLECLSAFFCYCYYWIDNGVPFYSLMFTYDNLGVNPRIDSSSDQLNEMINVSQSIYYSSLCVFQFFNFFATRTRYTSILEHNPIWGKGQNLYGFCAIIISTVIQLILTRVRWFNEVFGTAPVPIKYLIPSVGFGMVWLLIDEFRKLYIRKFARSIVAKIAW